MCHLVGIFRGYVKCETLQPLPLSKKIWITKIGVARFGRPLNELCIILDNMIIHNIIGVNIEPISYNFRLLSIYHIIANNYT